MKSFGIWYTQNAPPQRSQNVPSFSVSINHVRVVMDAAVKLDNQPRGCNGKIDDISSDRVLATNRITELPEMPERLPRGILCCRGGFTKLARSIRWAIHPLTLNPSPPRGEGLFNRTLHLKPYRRISLPMTDTTSRLDELEMRAAHQEQTIEDLNTAITEQWKIIERMERQLAALRDRVADAELSAGEAAPVDRPPPHW